MRSFPFIIASVLLAFHPAHLLAGTIEETLTIESPTTIHPGDVVEVLGSLQGSDFNYLLHSWSPNVTVQAPPSNTPVAVNYSYGTSFYSLTTTSLHATSTLLQATLLAGDVRPGGGVPVSLAHFTFSFIAPQAGAYTLTDSGIRQDSLGTENNGALTSFVVQGAVVPEPESFALLASCAVALGLFGATRPQFRRRLLQRAQ